MPTALLPASWELPTAIRERLGDDVGRQRAMVDTGHLLLVLHAPPQPDQDERVGRFYWRKPDGTWTPKGMTHGQLALGELLAEYEREIDDIDQAEDIAGNATEYFTVLTALNPLVRATRNLHDALQEARQAVPKDRQLIVLRDRAYNLSRRAELLYNDAKAALDFAIAKRGEEQAAASEQMAVASHRLNLLVAFFFPLATLCAIFGMELRHGFEQYDPPGPLIAILGIGLMLGLVLMLFMTRPTKRE
jgi:hypothetical protein